MTFYFPKRHKNFSFLAIILLLVPLSKASKFGGYEIPTGNISRSCNSFSFKTILYDDDEIERGHKEITKLLPYGRTNIRKFLETQNTDYLVDAGKEVGFVAIPAVLAMIISIFCIPGFFCFFFCRCCFNCLGLRDKPKKKKKRRRRRRRNDEDLTKQLTEDVETQNWEEDDGNYPKARGAVIGIKLRSKKGQCFIWYCSLLTIFLMIFAGAIWFYYFLNTVSGTKMTECAFSHFFNDIRGGVKDDDTVFGGIDGLRYLFGKLKGELGKLEKNNIPDLELAKKASDLKQSLGDYYTKFKDSTVSSCNPASQGKKIIPDLIGYLTPNINELIEQETELLESACMFIDFGGNIINDMAGGQVDQYKQTIDEFDAQLVDFRSQITDFEDKTIKTVDFSGNINLVYNIIYFVIGGTVIVLVSFLILMALSLKCGKCVSFSTTLQSLLAMLKIFFSALVNITAVAFIVNLCYFLRLGLDERKWAELILGDDNMQYIDLCLYKNSTGNLTTLLPEEESKELEQLQYMIRGFDIDLTDLNYTDDEPPSMKYYKENGLEKWLSYQLPDFTQNIEDSPEKQAALMNQIVGCVNNEVEIDKNKCNLKPVSTLQDTVDFRNTESYCLVPSLFSHLGIDQRYNTESTKCAVTSIPIYKSLKSCVNEHDALLNNMITSLNSLDEDTPRKRAVAIYNALFAGVDEINKIKSDLQETIEFVSGTEKEGGLSTLMNCTIVRREFKMLVGNVCYQFGINFAYQSLLLGVLGPLLTFISFCICCSVIRSEENDEIQKETNAVYT